VPFPRIDVLGVHPSLQTLLAQAAVVLVVIAAFLLNTRSDRKSVVKARSAA
jgi:high-affinity iron transporter